VKEEKKVKKEKKVKEEKHEKQALAVSVLYPGQSRFAYKTDKGALFVITFRFKHIEQNTITYVVRLFLFVSKDVKKFIKEFSFSSDLSDHKIVDLIQQVSNGIFAKTPHNYENFNEQVVKQILNLRPVKTKGAPAPAPSVTLISVGSSGVPPQLTLYFSGSSDIKTNELLESVPTNSYAQTINPGGNITYSGTITDLVKIDGPFTAVLGCNSDENTIVTIGNITVNDIPILLASTNNTISPSAINTPVDLSGLVLNTQLPKGSTLTVTLRNNGPVPFTFNTGILPVLSLITFTLA